MRSPLRPSARRALPAGPRRQRAPPRRDLVGGPRHLLAPLAVLAALAVALAASVSSSQAGSGLASLVLVTDRTPGRGAAAQLAAGVTGALVWFLAAAVLVSAGAVVLTALVGQGTVASGSAAASVVTMIARLGLSVAAVGALATALGLALPGRSLPTVLVIVGPVLVELLLLVVTRGTTDLIPGGTVGRARDRRRRAAPPAGTRLGGRRRPGGRVGGRTGGRPPAHRCRPALAPPALTLDRDRPDPIPTSEDPWT